MADIFLSYSREDHARAEQIAKALTAAGYEVFWDVEIPPGKSWADVLEEKLAVCKAAIVLWSKISTASKWVREEARLAHDRGKLIPVQIDDAPPPFGFGEIQAADLKHWRGDIGDPHWRTFLNAVSAAVARPPSTTPAATVTTARTTPLQTTTTPPVSTIGSWLGPATRGYVLAGIGVVALGGAVALRYLPASSQHSADGSGPADSTTVTDGGSTSRSGTGTSESGTPTPARLAPPPPTPPAASDDAVASAGVTRQDILNYLNTHGYSAKLATDTLGNSIVKTEVDGITFNVYFYDCQGESCPDIQFSAGWQMSKAPSAELVNEWNRSRRLARVYTSEKGDGLFIEMDMNLANADAAGEIAEYLRMWKLLLGKFKTHFSL